VLTLTIYALRAYIALRPVGAALESIGASAKLAWLGAYLLKGTLITLAVILGVVAVAVALLALPLVLAAVAIFAVVAAVQYLIGVLSGAVANFDQIKAAVLTALSGWADGALAAAGSLIDGLVQGISSGAGRVADAVRAMASQALGSFTGVFQIRSPSRVMLRHGKENIAGAAAQGVDDGAEDMDRAMAGLGVKPDGKGGARGGGGRVFAPVFTNCTFGAGLTEAQLREWMSRWWEEMSATGPEPEPAT
jgi:phage-related protein